MRAIKITLHTNKPIVLPLAYNELVQGLLYSCWRQSFPELHDSGFGSTKAFRLFTFGPLNGKRSIDSKAKTVRFEKTISFEVRSPIEELLDELAQQLCNRNAIRIGAHELELVNLQCCDRLLFPQRAILKTVAPIVAYKSTEDNHTRYFSPNEPEWNELLQVNVSSKASVFGAEPETAMAIIPKAETLRKHVTRFKGTYITGWTGEFIVAANPELLSLLYFCGLGAKNSQGFGMFDILDERP